MRRLSVAQQAAAYLREGLRRGRWRGTLPGVARLARELDISPATLQAALRELEGEGLLEGRGRGFSRKIIRRETAQCRLRVGILLYDKLPDEDSQVLYVLLKIQHDLEASGHEVFFSSKSQVQFRHDFRRIVRFLGEHPADAWIVTAGSRPLLEWCAAQTAPYFALYGHTDGLEIARGGPDKAAAYTAATRRLVDLGHRRIVLISRRERRKPKLGNIEQLFLNELAAHGIATGEYNLPDWEETPDGFAALLERLFRISPPSALFIQETSQLPAVLQFLLRRRLAVPQQVSLLCADYDHTLHWYHPSLAHTRWDSDAVVSRVTRWVAAVRGGNADRKTINVPAEFIPGGSIGPAPAVGKLLRP